MSNFFAYPEFQRKFGKDYGGDVGYQVSGPWQSALSMASTAGAIFGQSPVCPDALSVGATLGRGLILAPQAA